MWAALVIGAEMCVVADVCGGLESGMANLTMCGGMGGSNNDVEGNKGWPRDLVLVITTERTASVRTFRNTPMVLLNSRTCRVCWPWRDVSLEEPITRVPKELLVERSAPRLTFSSPPPPPAIYQLRCGSFLLSNQ